MKRSVLLVSLIILISLIGTNVYAEKGTSTWYKSMLQPKISKTEVNLDKLEDLVKTETNYINDSTNNKGIAQKVIERVLGKTKSGIKNHHDTYSFEVEKTKSELLKNNYDDYETKKEKEINGEVSEDVEEIIKEIFK